MAAGMLKTPAAMIRCIRAPRSIDPETVMPEMGVLEHDARDITGFLYTLKSF
jgi:hypothetical protein